MAQTTGRAVGVDFGTSTSLVAERMGVRPAEILALGSSTKWVPSLAGYRGEELLVGEDADDLLSHHVIRSIKRAITENLDVVMVASHGGPREVPADDVIVAVLSEIGRRAAAEGRPLKAEKELRLGCPAMWDGGQRQRLLDLAARAGLPVDSSILVDEPIAAGVAWVTHRFLFYGERPEGRLLVFDMGGGTLDIAVLQVEGGERPEISVLSALGVARAGDALDQAIADELAADLGQQGVDIADLSQPDEARGHLLREARVAKMRLSLAHTHPISLPHSLGKLPGLSYSREQLEEAFRPQMDEAEQLVWAALRAALLTERGSSRTPEELRRLGPADLAGSVKYVLLAGGMSQIPYVERRIGALFPRAQVFDHAGVAAEEAIVAGLADTGGYERLNLHRPGFDFILEWQEGSRRKQHTIYSAYTPFYERWKVLNGQSHLGYEWRGDRFPGPRDGAAVLRARSTSGELLGLEYNNEPKDGINLRLGRKLMLKLYCDGRILIREGDGRTFLLRVDRWPVIRGRDYAQLVLKSAEDEAPPPSTAWYLEKEWAPPAQRAPRR
ncbi:Hsp70 family protein [Micromonospora aurantiaca]|uniref:Hsp70 family protein n=1 Tax=Micromonospora aurantiaca (nom. illeg.) TaxID=47850 RepID=UPI0013C30A9D|nr:Hsp70 family protein [Micromonospora aurantiaca]